MLDANPKISGSVCNVGSSTDVRQLFEDAINRMGQVDVLVNCVGIAGARGPLEEISDDDWRTCMEVNVNGAFYTMKHAIPGMKRRQKGSIVNFSTASTRTRLPNRAPYIVSKYAVEALTKNTARELGPYNIRCNAILPGPINNARLNGVFQQVAYDRGMSIDQFEKEALRFVSMRSKVEPVELADVVLFLCSDKAPHITGQLVEVSGGLEWEE